MTWWEIDEECPDCGALAEVDTKQPEGFVLDGDPVRCQGCGHVGIISCDAETDPYVIWSDEDPHP